MSHATSAVRPEPDQLLVDIADYVSSYTIDSELAYETARLCLMDAIGCHVLALTVPACTKLLGPVVEGADLPGGARVPGTRFELDPVQAAFNIGTLVRWVDFNDTWLAAEWGHPSDNLGAILATADYLSRRGRGLIVRDVLTAMIKAYEIQGVLALENAFNRVGLDHVLLVRVASAAVVTGLLGGSRSQIIDAVSQAFLDGGTLRAYRHAPNTGPRKSWAAGDAASRAVRLALITMTGEIGYPSALTAPTWGFHDVFLGGRALKLARPFGSYVMENILFKVAFPAEFHAQTAVEAAMHLHPQVAPRLREVERVVIETQESAIRIISKTGPLNNPADRDHCIQYMVAVPLIFGTLTAAHYQDDVAGDARIDALRQKMHVQENRRYSIDYLDPGKRSIPNSVEVFFEDGSKTPRVEMEYPLGHRRRRQEAMPLLREKCKNSLRTRFDEKQARSILAVFDGGAKLDALEVGKFVEMLTV
jgi:2-methylcitrate dehydratase